MARRHHGVTVLAFCAVLAAVASPVAAAEWRNYRSAEFGFSILYPADLFGAPYPDEAGNGVTFPGLDGEAALLVFGGRNTRQFSPQSAAGDLSSLADVGRVTYRRVADDWIVLSGYLGNGAGEKAGYIFYERIEFSADRTALSGFRLEYSVTARALYDPLIGAIGQSLTPPLSGN